MHGYVSRYLAFVSSLQFVLDSTSQKRTMTSPARTSCPLCFPIISVARFLFIFVPSLQPLIFPFFPDFEAPLSGSVSSQSTVVPAAWSVRRTTRRRENPHLAAIATNAFFYEMIIGGGFPDGSRVSQATVSPAMSRLMILYRSRLLTGWSRFL